MTQAKKEKKKRRKPLLSLTGEEAKAVSEEDASKYILDSIYATDEQVREKLEKINKWINSESAWAEAWAPTEAVFWDRFRRIVKKQNEYFSINHVDSLGLDYEVLIFLGKKNIGKTFEIYRLMREVIARGEKFIYVRYSANELAKSLHAFNNDSASPVYMIEDRKVFKFYLKEEIYSLLERKNIDRNYNFTSRFLNSAGLDFVGYGYEFTYCQSYTGSQYEDFSTVFYDECLTYDPRNTLKEAHLNNWAAFLSSIARNKDNLKVLLFGNLQGTNNKILDFYGIRRDDKFRYIVRGGDDSSGCRVLFINGGSLYKGYDNQTRGARHGGGLYAFKLEENEYLTTSGNLIEPKAFDKFSYYSAFVVDLPRLGPHLYLIKNYEVERDTILWAVKVTPYYGYESFLVPIYSSNTIDCLKFTKLTFIPTIRPYIETLLFNIVYGRIRFFDEDSISRCNDLMTIQPFKLPFVTKERVI